MKQLFICSMILMTVSAAVGQRRTAGTTQGAVGTTIRQVDFLDFTYTTSLCTKDVGIGPEVTVHNGEFKQGNDADEAYFGVVDNKVVYGDLTGDGQEEAVVHTACGRTAWNYGLEEFFVYTRQNDSLRLVARVNQDQMVNDYQRNYPEGVLWSTRFNGVRVRSGSLLIDWNADGAHCCPEHIVTMQYRLDGEQLMAIARPVRRPFTTEASLRATRSVSAAPDDPSQRWATFWRVFLSAVNTRNRVALKRMMATDFFDGLQIETPDAWLRTVDGRGWWRELQKSFAAGTVISKTDGSTMRLTKDGTLYFQFKNGRWYFAGVMGD